MKVSQDLVDLRDKLMKELRQRKESTDDSKFIKGLDER